MLVGGHPRVLVSVVVSVEVSVEVSVDTHLSLRGHPLIVSVDTHLLRKNGQPSDVLYRWGANIIKKDGVQ